MRIAHINNQFFGLENSDGHYNCFLNVVIQSFWNIVPFRQAILQEGQLIKRNLSPNTLIGNFCKELFQFFNDVNKNLSNSEQSPGILQASTKNLRINLFKIFYLEQIFNLNEKADASEAFTKILELLHGYYLLKKNQYQAPNNS